VCAALLMAMASLSFAATCAADSYSSSCSKCSFDSTGKMNKACYDEQQNSGLECLFTTYPVQSSEYKLGMCPGIDTCVERLTACKERLTAGNDSADCKAGNVLRCFVQSDACVEAATADCGKPPPEQPLLELPKENPPPEAPAENVTDVIYPPYEPSDTPKGGMCPGFLGLIMPPALFVFCSGRKRVIK
jgi:hypothetical protein